MHYSTLLLSSLLCGNAVANVMQVLDRRAACNADNCARLVTGTSSAGSVPNRSSRSRDCASFLSTTVTPATFITTTTVTITPGQPTVSQPPVTSGTPVTVSPRTVPSYVSTSCGGPATSSARYSSACSCFPVTSTVTTASAPTVTSTVYATSTPAAGSMSCYQLVATPSDATNPILNTKVTINKSSTSSSCALSGGYLVLALSGLYGVNAVSYSASGFDEADNCLYPDKATVVDGGGISFTAAGSENNLFYTGGYLLYQDATQDEYPVTVTLTPLAAC